MELYSLEVFLTVVTERSFSRAAQKLYRTQPAISLALQRLEQEVGEKLIDRGPKDFTLTDAGHTVLEFARRFTNLQQEMGDALAELRDKSAGREIDYAKGGALIRRGQAQLGADRWIRAVTDLGQTAVCAPDLEEMQIGDTGVISLHHGHRTICAND